MPRAITFLEAYQQAQASSHRRGASWGRNTTVSAVRRQIDEPTAALSVLARARTDEMVALSETLDRIGRPFHSAELDIA